MNMNNSNEDTDKLIERLMAKIKQNGKVIEEITRQTAEIKKRRKLLLLEYVRNN